MNSASASADRRTSAAANHRGETGGDGFVRLLRTDEMDVGVDAAGGDDVTFTGDDLGAGTDDHRVFLFRLGIDVDMARSVGHLAHERPMGSTAQSAVRHLALLGDHADNLAGSRYVVKGQS